MIKNIVSLREIQRNYRKLINQVKRTKTPLYLGARSKPEVVLLDIETYEDLDRKANGTRKSWKEIEADLEEIRKSGKQNVNLAEFVYADRHRH